MGPVDIGLIALIGACGLLGLLDAGRRLMGFLFGLMFGCLAVAVVGIALLDGPWSESTQAIVQGSAVLRVLAGSMSEFLRDVSVSRI